MIFGGAGEKGEGRDLSLLQHLDELRRRLMWCLVVVIALFVTAWVFRERLLAFLMQPHIDAMRSFGLPVKLHVLGYVEAFFALLKISFATAILVASPFILYQIWKFVSVALHTNERRWVLRFLPASILLFLGGMCFCFFGFFPMGLRFLVIVGGDLIEPTITLESYLSLVLWLSIMMGVAFQLPIVMYFLSKIGIATGAGFRSARRVAILVIFIVAAVITPTPDPFTQSAVALPMIALYEVGIFLCERTWRNLRNVIVFFLLIALVPVGAHQYNKYYAERAGTCESGVAQIEYDGTTRALSAGSFVPLHAVCRTDATSTLTFSFGKGVQVKLNRETKIVLPRSDAIDLQAGELWAHCDTGARLTIMTIHGQFKVVGSEADISVTDESATVIAIAGTVSFVSEGREGTVAAGRKRVFATTGEAVNVTKAVEWTKPAASKPAEQAPAHSGGLAAPVAKP